MTQLSIEPVYCKAKTFYLLTLDLFAVLITITHAEMNLYLLVYLICNAFQVVPMLRISLNILLFETKLKQSRIFSIQSTIVLSIKNCEVVEKA